MGRPSRRRAVAVLVVALSLAVVAVGFFPGSSCPSDGSSAPYRLLTSGGGLGCKGVFGIALPFDTSLSPWPLVVLAVVFGCLIVALIALVTLVRVSGRGAAAR